MLLLIVHWRLGRREIFFASLINGIKQNIQYRVCFSQAFSVNYHLCLTLSVHSFNIIWPLKEIQIIRCQEQLLVILISQYLWQWNQYCNINQSIFEAMKSVQCDPPFSSLPCSRCPWQSSALCPARLFWLLVAVM